MPFLTRYNRRRVSLSCLDPSLTETSDFASTLVPNILAAHGLPLSTQPPMYGDFASVPPDLLTALDRFDDAVERFESLPSAVRERFGNSPRSLLQFLSDPSNRPEAVRLGLIPPDVSPEVASSPSASPEGSTSSPT